MVYKVSSRGGLGCLIFGILGLVAAFFIMRGLYFLLYWLSPVLLVLALVINWRAVTDTLKNWLKGMETNPVGGLFTAALAVLLFPFFFFYLLMKALGYSKIEQMQREFGQARQPEDEFVEYEELESTPKGGQKTNEPMEPPVLPEEEPAQPRPAAPKNPYDEFFGK
jgi:hypothetical protein